MPISSLCPVSRRDPGHGQAAIGSGGEAGRQGKCTRERRERTPPGAEPSGRVANSSRANTSLGNWSKREPVVRSAGASRATRHRAPRLCPPARHGHRRAGETKSAYPRRAHDRHGRMTPRVPQPSRVRVRLERSGAGPSGAGGCGAEPGQGAERSEHRPSTRLRVWGYGVTLGSIFRCRPRNELRRRACTRG